MATAFTEHALADCLVMPLRAAAKSSETPTACAGSRLENTSKASSQAFENPRASWLIKSPLGLSAMSRMKARKPALMRFRFRRGIPARSFS